jgi:E3 ubiquitin-protein ligase SHPRH
VDRTCPGRAWCHCQPFQSNHANRTFALGPVCKRHLVIADFHQITYKPQELKAQEEHSEPSSPSQGSSKSSTPGSSLYADIGNDTLAQIKSIDLNGSFGTKIDTLARHILWIRQHDPGAKAIVFSQFREFLDVLGTALKQFGIGYSRMGKPGAVDKFKNDASIECFLLDAKTDSSGLNLVNAQYVFLAEPLINTSLACTESVNSDQLPSSCISSAIRSKKPFMKFL